MNHPRSDSGSYRCHRQLWTLVVIPVLAPHVAGQCEIDKLVSTDPHDGDRFGAAVSIHDEQIALVGVPLDDDGMVVHGSAYVFRRANAGWVEEAKLLAPGQPMDTRFGTSVAIEGDRAVVGAPSGQAGVGAVYVFSFEGDTWVLKSSLSQGIAGDQFGTGVALYGDSLMCGAPGYDDGTGAVYAFRREGDTWIMEDLLTSDGSDDDVFGAVVAIDDGLALVGASGVNVMGIRDAGAAYVFRRERAQWVQEIKLTASDPGDSDRFGSSVAIDNALAIVGAKFDNPRGSDSGSAYIFVYDGTWQQDAKLTASDGAAEDQFGFSVAAEGGVMVVGAPFHDDTDPNVGAAYVYRHTESGWDEAGRIAPSDADGFDTLGWSAAVSGDLAVVGAQGGNAAYVLGGMNATDCNLNEVPDTCDIASGKSEDTNGNGVPDECEPCPGDLNDDRTVDFTDLLILLAVWGPCEGGCFGADIDEDGEVGFADLLLLLAAWGKCP